MRIHVFTGTRHRVFPSRVHIGQKSLEPVKAVRTSPHRSSFLAFLGSPLLGSIFLVLSVVIFAASTASAQAAVKYKLESELTGGETPIGSFTSEGLTVDDASGSASLGDLYVANYGTEKVLDKFKDEAGKWKYVCHITGTVDVEKGCESTSGPPAFGTTYGPAIAAGGEVLVPDNTNSVVDRFSATGEYLGQITGVGKATGVAVGPTGAIYIASNNLGIVYEYESGTLKEFKGGFGASAGLRVAVDDDSTSASYGDVYIADKTAKTVYKYNSKAEKKQEITGLYEGATLKATLDEPEGMAVGSQGDLFIADYGAGTVYVLNDEGEYLAKIEGKTGEEKTKAGSIAPDDVALDSEGRIYVDDQTNKVVDIFKPLSSSLKYKFKTEVTGEDTLPGSATYTSGFTSQGLVVDDALTSPSFGDLYVANYGTEKVVDKFKEESGAWKYVCQITGLGSASTSATECNTSVAGPGAFGTTYGPAIAAGGEVLVPDNTNSAVDRFSATGEYLGQITGVGKTTGVAVGPTGTIYIASNNLGIVYKYESGTLNEFVTGFTASAGLRVAVDNDSTSSSYGDVYVADKTTKTVYKYNSSAEKKQEITGLYEGTTLKATLDEPEGMAVGAQGDLFVADYGAGTVYVLNDEGEYVTALTGKETKATSMAPNDVALDSAGDVYVDDLTNKVVDIFSEAPPEAQWITKPATDGTEEGATLNGTVNPEGEAVGKCEFDYASDGEYKATSSYTHTIKCEQTPATIGTGTSPVSVSAEVSGLTYATKYDYRIAGEASKKPGDGEKESFTTPDKIACQTEVKIKPITEVGQNSAKFNGEVNPCGQPTTYRLEYSTTGGNWIPLAEESLGAGTSPIPVDETVTGLEGDKAYKVRLEAENRCEAGVSGCGSSSSSEESFETLAGPPAVAGVGVTYITGSEATLHATINPEGQPSASYRFEYGTSTSYGTTVPAGEGTIGAQPEQVSETITGLQPDTLYHFRVISSNGIATATVTADQTFTTLADGEGETLSVGSCANEATRAESNIDPATGSAYSLRLPECRAYEQVTPPFKSFDTVNSTNAVLAGAQTEAVAADGNELLELSVPSLGTGNVGSDEELTGTLYTLTRDAAGWSAIALNPPTAVFPDAYDELASTTNIATGIWAAGTATAPITAERLYVRGEDGQFLAIGPLAPPSATTGPARGSTSTHGLAIGSYGVVGASSGLNDVVFQMESPSGTGETSYLWPGDDTVAGSRPSLYEYVGTGHTGEGTDVPALVGVTNAGAQIGECGTGLGADVVDEGNVGAQPSDVREAAPHAVSAGGSTVFFTVQSDSCEVRASGPASNQVYARIGVPGDSQVTVNVAATSECSISVSCNLTAPVKYQGSSKNGSKVFFTTSQALLPSDKDATGDLYECELPGDGGSALSPMGTVNACPRLKGLTLTGTSTGAEVQSVAAVSEEGSRVYFVAKGAISSEPDLSLPAGDQKPAPGSDNLYLWEAPGTGDSSGRTAFVATLPSGSSTVAEAQATPNGEYLVFTSTGDITNGDTSTAAQAFRYDAQTDEVVRVSVGAEGFNVNGNTDSDPATLASAKLGMGRLTISDDGSYVLFQSSDALTPGVVKGTNNVYEWHNGDVQLISDGTDTSPNAGLIGIDATGRNIFFTTASKLVGQDTDEDVDVYDARIDGGFPAPTPETKCEGEVCQGSLTAPLTEIIPGSTGAASIGNLQSPGLKLPGEAETKTISKPKTKVKTRAEKLKAAVKSCGKDKRKSKRKVCVRHARKEFGQSKKAKK